MIFRLFPVRILLLWVLLLSAGCNLATNRQNLDGKRRFELGQHRDALQSFYLALQNDPANPDSHYNIARTLHQMGNDGNNKNLIQQAEVAYRQALRLNPVHQPSYRGLSVLMAENKRGQEAFALVQGWMQIRPDSAEPRIELARLYYEFGNNSTATQLLSDALAIDFDNDRALRAIGALREQSGETQQALLDYQRSLQINPMQPGLSNRVAQLRLNNRVSPASSPVYSNRTASRATSWPRY